MKMIRAIIQPHRLDMVRDALQELGIAGMTAFQAQGFGRQKGHKEVYRGAEYTVYFQPKNLLEIVVEDAQVEDVCSMIEKTAKTGNIGDGKIFVLDVEKAIRIRTGEVNESAL
jgi:nitrogen regulatory protein PII